MEKFAALYAASAGARAGGLHDALLREIELDNPHAVFPLLRAYVDLVIVTMEVRRNPSYAAVVAHDPRTTTLGRRRKTSQSLVNAAMREVPDMRAAWDLLSEMGGHFGWAAFQTPMTFEHLPDGGRQIVVSTGRGWQDPEMKAASHKHVDNLTRSMANLLVDIVHVATKDDGGERSC